MGESSDSIRMTQEKWFGIDSDNTIGERAKNHNQLVFQSWPLHVWMKCRHTADLAGKLLNYKLIG